MASEIFQYLLLKFYSLINYLTIRLIKYKIKRLENKINRAQKVITGTYAILSKLYSKLSSKEQVEKVGKEFEQATEQVEKIIADSPKDKTVYYGIEINEVSQVFYFCKLN